MAQREFEPVLSPKAWEYLRSLSKRRQERLTRLIYQLANDPFRQGNYQSRDHIGRVLKTSNLAPASSPTGQMTQKKLRTLALLHEL
jgi:hypothetical protein